jgi:hypothetical protein
MRYVLVAASLTFGCKKVEPAPAELDALFHYVWDGYDAGEDEVLHEAIRNLDAAVDGASVDGPADGSLTPLSDEQGALVGVTDRSPTAAAGVYLVNLIRCDLGALEQILTEPAQDQLYEGTYESYSRDYHGDIDGFLQGADHTLSWDVTYTASVLGAGYTASLDSSLRRVVAMDDETSPWGDVMLARAYLPEPAEFDSDNKTLDQDYQLEAYWQRAPGEIVHAYAVWRQADWGAGFTSDDDGIQRLMLNALADWDETTDELCASGAYGG